MLVSPPPPVSVTLLRQDGNGTPPVSPADAMLDKISHFAIRLGKWKRKLAVKL